MSIEVPSSAPPPGPPQIWGNHLSQGEQDAVLHLNGLLACLGHYEWQFRHTVTLFDLCRGEPAKADIKFPIIEQKANTLRAWEEMAARDGAMAIYHFGQALTAIARGLGARRFEVLPLIILPNRVNNAISGRLEAKAAPSERLTPSRTATWRTVWPSRNSSAARCRTGGFRSLATHRIPALPDSVTNASTMASKGKAPSPTSVRAFSTWTSNRAPCSGE
jgi:hypothetical protein